MQVDSASLTPCLPIRDELRQQHGFVHGGVVSTSWTSADLRGRAWFTPA